MTATMRLLARWHIWLGWLAAVPLLLWTISGLAMTLRPIEETRGTDRLIERPAQPLARDTKIAIDLQSQDRRPVTSVVTRVERGIPVTRISYADGSFARFRADGTEMGPISEVEARLIVAESVRGGDRPVSSRRFKADAPADDFRRPVDTWQVVLQDGARVYVSVESGTVEAIRTPWWRFYDFMWGLHIMDLQTREDMHHPVLIGFAAIALSTVLLGSVLMFRRRKARVRS